MSTRATSTSKLEVENKQMENRIRLLKEMMSAEKTRRELDGGIHWQSGRSGPLQRDNSTTLAPSNNSLQSRNLSQKKPMKVKILTDKNICKQTVDRKANLPKCGQCEKASALLSCVECIENYCQLCFTKMHQKGSLAKHHVKPILQKVKHLSPKKVENSLAPQEPLQPPQEKGKHSLLEGNYDEAASAKSFQDALAEWRGGNPVKESNTYTTRESSVGTKSETPTMAATTQVDMNPGKAKKLSVEFSDANKVTYFEKLLLRKFRDSPVFLNTDHSTEDQVVSSKSEDEDDNMDMPAVSQYNLFYNPEITEPGSSSVETDTFEDFDFYTAPSDIVVEEVLPSTADQLPCSVEVTPLEQVPVTATSSASTAREEGTTVSSATNSQMPKASNADSEQAAHKRKRKRKGQRERKRRVDVQQDSKQPDFSSAVKAAWSTSSQSGHGQQQMTQFFLHGVKPPEADQEVSKPKPFPMEPLEGANQFKLGSAVWLPSSSLQPADPDTSPNQPRNETPPLAPPSRPATRDYFYDDETDSDSDDAAHERAAFINSRLGMARDSIQELEPARPASSYRELEEEEERMERDRADCQCLDELAWELASTVECEGRLTRCEELDQEEEEEEGVDGAGEYHSDSATRVPEGAEDVEMQGVDMSRVISEFELYQKELMEEDQQ